MFNKYYVVALLVLLFARLSHADTEPLEINGGNDGMLQFRNFDEKYGGWSDIKYKGATGEFNIYMVPSKMVTSEEGIVASSDMDMVSPDKKYVMVQRTNAGEVTDEEGNKIISSQAYCDAVSLETGCVKNVGSALQCDGVWQGQKWKITTGETFDFPKGGMSPQYLLSEVASVSSNESRSDSLRDSFFMGVSSYMACYPPEKSISEYNDIGFYFAQGGEHLLAMQIYNRLLSLAPDRVPLKLNVADSLWALGKHDEAKPYYAAYREAMLKKGGASKIPKRVVDRLN
ncbi:MULTISPECIES: tetratricopeptide repeat protein [Pseudomonas]|uniref:Tetratricopeptide repeat protein n=3 Tax=Pseudomonas chlororaphis TaxID=587753 RepID=A0AAP9VZ08_9PSED|nr:MULTISPECIES: tetratricopeptide repeat protein [Pseudomonas]AUG43941.1 tetratricopeptide repeat-containing protein [Pseudomonas chlororaphis]AZC66516.1 hypothetical protein C4K33_6069 [Pseudomonas chlororaphis subsp. piscium]AZE32921.1 hypothetical protein C4K07_6181 [Pseudomonas chlororaphis subsp. aureofaciens]AZE39227.1 hypothetical protein C4K06_6239 [Pseudomonas chlororaphis subsp. aureofaciens]AZE45565.1 hypothetical protein C4K05_6270 [Pseudomonas chlororaphis subsp. aureofaciens]